MPQPRYADIRRFCQVDGWEELGNIRGGVGDHRRYRKILDDGTVLRTRASHSSEQIGDPGLWRHIWRDQLGLEGEAQFWDALRTGRPVERGRPGEPAPETPSLPGWLVDALVHQAGVPLDEVREMTEHDARARLHAHYARPPDAS